MNSGSSDPIEYSIGPFSYILNGKLGAIVTNITTSLQYLNLFIDYFLRRIKDKLVSR